MLKDLQSLCARSFTVSPGSGLFHRLAGIEKAAWLDSLEESQALKESSRALCSVVPWCHQNKGQEFPALGTKLRRKA